MAYKVYQFECLIVKKDLVHMVIAQKLKVQVPFMTFSQMTKSHK